MIGGFVLAQRGDGSSIVVPSPAETSAYFIIAQHPASSLAFRLGHRVLRCGESGGPKSTPSPSPMPIIVLGMRRISHVPSL